MIKKLEDLMYGNNKILNFVSINYFISEQQLGFNRQTGDSFSNLATRIHHKRLRAPHRVSGSVIVTSTVALVVFFKRITKVKNLFFW